MARRRRSKELAVPDALTRADYEISQRVLGICRDGSGPPWRRAQMAADALRLHFGSLRTKWLIEDAERGFPHA